MYMSRPHTAQTTLYGIMQRIVHCSNNVELIGKTAKYIYIIIILVYHDVDLLDRVNARLAACSTHTKKLVNVLKF